MAPVFRTLEGLAPYADTVEAMKAHAAAIRAGTAVRRSGFSSIIRC